tara:strand:- start:561 stop:776 length:216 start_codon:yes stop_codon:yes gene_type:complete
MSSNQRQGWQPRERCTDLTFLFITIVCLLIHCLSPHEDKAMKCSVAFSNQQYSVKILRWFIAILSPSAQTQ